LALCSGAEQTIAIIAVMSYRYRRKQLTSQIH